MQLSGLGELELQTPLGSSSRGGMRSVLVDLVLRTSFRPAISCRCSTLVGWGSPISELMRSVPPGYGQLGMFKNLVLRVRLSELWPVWGGDTCGDGHGRLFVVSGACQRPLTPWQPVAGSSNGACPIVRFALTRPMVRQGAPSDFSGMQRRAQWQRGSSLWRRLCGQRSLAWADSAQCRRAQDRESPLGGLDEARRSSDGNSLCPC